MKSYFEYIKDLFSLATPMIMGSLGIILIGAGDVFVASKHSTDTLAAISIANSIMMIIFLFGIGLLVGISPLLSNFRGERSSIKKYFLPSINFSQILALLSMFLIWVSIIFVDRMHFDPVLVPIIKKYMFICSFSVFGAYLQVALKEYLQAFEIVIFPNFLNLAGVLVHLYLNFIFVFGWYGMPAMGATGLAVSTLLSRLLLGLIMLLYCLRFINVRFYHDLGYFVSLLRIGFPIAVATLLESAAFNVITIMIGGVSGVYAAAQSILLTISTATFMIPMAISNAIAVKVGYANGAANYTDLKKYSFAGLGVSSLFMTFCATCFILFPSFFIRIFTQDVRVIAICVPIMFLMGIFQIFDGLQVTLGGIFKGIKNTKIVMAGNFVAYWVIGLPLGFVLAFSYDLNLFGFWIGLTVSIFALAVILGLLLKDKFEGYKTF